jgi:acid phosphatase family membrane protein YuiD
LLTLRRRIVTIRDLAGLRKLAGFQGGYLNARD